MEATAVERIAAVVTHDEHVSGRDGDRREVRHRRARRVDIMLVEHPAADLGVAATTRHGRHFRQTDDPFDEESRSWSLSYARGGLLNTTTSPRCTACRR